MEDIFTNIYNYNIWGNNNNINYNGSSGDGSLIENNIHSYIPFLKKFIIDKKIKTVVDLGCGDFLCGHLVYDDLDISYTGYDIYKKLIDHHKKSFSLPKYDFQQLDICNNKENIIDGDLYILKDILMHWSLSNINTFLDYLIKKKNFKYILICNCCDQKEDNTDIKDGMWRKLSCDFFPLKKYNPKKILKFKSNGMKEISIIENSNYFNNKSRKDKDIGLVQDLYKSLENIKYQKNKLYNGYQIYNYGIDDYISKSIIEYGVWEPNITCLINNIINNSHFSENNILDIGCNIGYHTLICQKHNKVIQIYAVDGNHININLLELSCKINKILNVTLIKKCISNDIDYYEPSNQDIVNKVKNIGGLSFKKSNRNQGIISTTIDNIVTENNIKNVLIMKIDIEGGELNALKGSLNTLRSDIIQNIIIEISPFINNDSIEILQILHNNNYSLYNIPHQETGKLNNDINLLEYIKKYPITNISYFVSCISRQTNILAVKQHKFKKIAIYADWIEEYLTLEPFIFIKNLEKYDWQLLKLSNIDINELKKTKSIVLCVTYDSFNISQLKCDNIKLIYKIDDLYPFKDIRKTCIDSADILIGPYQYLFNEDEVINMYPLINTKETYHIPYSSVNSFYKNIELNQNPIQKIFVSGCINYTYPLRQHILKYSKYIDRLPHPNYNNYNHDKINKEYYNILSKYLCCFTDALSFKYVLLKVFEICSVGSLLLCEDSVHKQLTNLGFIDNVNYISCNKVNLESKINWILNENNRKIVDEIRLRGMNLVREHHNTSNRSELFNIIINNKYFQKNYIATFNSDFYFTPDKIQVDYINNGMAEPYRGEINIINEYITKTKRCNTYLDIGVNIGTHSLVYSKIFKYIIAFEPDKYNYNQSKENLLINNVTNVKLLNKALGSKKGFVKTFQHSNHSRGCIMTTFTNNKTDTEQITLDSLELNNIDLIKIDVEGNELNVLKGALETIQRNKPIIEFEYNHLAKKLNIEYNDIEKFLNNINYNFDKRFDDNYFYIYK
jgi:FkbM family methyltransferase